MAQVTTRETSVAELKVASAVTATVNNDDNNGIPLGDVGELEGKAALLLGWASENMGPTMQALDALDEVLAKPPANGSNDRFKRSLLERLLGSLRALRLELAAFTSEQVLGNTLSGQIEGLRELGTRLARREGGGALAVTRDDVAHAQRVVAELLAAFRGMLNSTAGLLLQASEVIELTDRDDKGDGDSKKKKGGRRDRGAVTVQFGVRGGGYWTRDRGEQAEQMQPHIVYANDGKPGDDEKDEKGGDEDTGEAVGVKDGKVALPVLHCGATTCTGCSLSGSCTHEPTAAEQFHEAVENPTVVTDPE